MIGDIKPIYEVTGFQVQNNKGEWIPVEKISEAEILSFIYKDEQKIN